jgi:hypothetical protein
MSLEKVQQGLISLYTTAFASWLTNQVAWENKPFNNPPDGKHWMAVHFMPAVERAASLGSDGENQHDGVLQIDLNIPSGTGEGNSRETIGALFTCFPQGSFEYSGQQIKILSRSRGPGMTANGFYKIPFTVRWRAYINRNS